MKTQIFWDAVGDMGCGCRMGKFNREQLGDFIGHLQRLRASMPVVK